MSGEYTIAGHPESVTAPALTATPWGGTFCPGGARKASEGGKKGRKKEKAEAWILGSGLVWSSPYHTNEGRPLAC